MGVETRRLPRGERFAVWIALAVTATVVVIASPWLATRAGTVALVNPDDPWVRLDREVTTEFGMENPVLWMIEARSGTIWTRPVLSAVVELTRGAMRIPGVRGVDVMSLASPNVRQVRQTPSGISPEYLMVSVPPTDAEIAELARRVESDPNFAGTLVTRDGRAAMVVANFAPESDGEAVAHAALDLARRVEGEDALVHVVGAPVLVEEARRSVAGVLVPAGVALFLVLAASIFVLGAWRLLAVGVAVLLTAAWAGLGLALAGALVWPWSGLGLLPALLLAATATVACETTTAGELAWSRVLAVGAILAAGFAAYTVVMPFPMRAFGVAGAIGSLASVGAGRLAAPMAGALPRAAGRWAAGSWLTGFALAVAAAAALGLPFVGASFSFSGYGERYLPQSAAESLRRVREVMAPPTQLALRLRGEPGFVSDPAVLRAVDEVVETARGDPRVERAQSLADIVKLVHRTFNDDDPAYGKIPDDRGLVARYLALAYSPAFRRFVDRGLGRTAVWFHLSTDRADDVAEVIGALDAQMSRAPIPSAQVDVWAGDGALLVVMARMAHSLIAGALALVAGTALAAALLLGWGAAGRVVAGAVLAAAVATGGLGWIGAPLDLLSLGCAVGAAAAGAGAGAWRRIGRSGTLAPLAAATAVAGMIAIAAPLVATKLIGLQLLGSAVALLVVGRSGYAEATF